MSVKAPLTSLIETASLPLPESTTIEVELAPVEAEELGDGVDHEGVRVTGLEA